MASKNDPMASRPPAEAPMPKMGNTLTFFSYSLPSRSLRLCGKQIDIVDTRLLRIPGSDN